MKGFNFEEGRIKQEIIKLGAKRVLLQLPEGLKPEAPIIAEFIEKLGALPIISVDPCYGACDMALCEAEGLDVDLIVHFGHSKMVKHEKVPTLYIEAHAMVPVEKVVIQTIPLLAGYTNIGIATSVQHLQTLKQVRYLLTQAGKTVIIGDSRQILYPGQVSGCNYSNVKTIADKVEAFIFIGGGLFHALGIALSTGKPTMVADPFDNRAFCINSQAEKILRQRYAIIQAAKKARTLGVVIGLKPGQKHFDTALKIKLLAEKNRKSSFLFAGREITPEVLLEFPSIDAYVNTACPRICLESTCKFSKPVLTVTEFMVVLGEISWENLLKEGLFEN
jgi:2-(3-amino-3-carboxypropyl)histidine synthase